MNHNHLPHAPAPHHTPTIRHSALFALFCSFVIFILFLVVQVISIYAVARVLLPSYLDTAKLITLGAANGQIVSLSMFINTAVMIVLSVLGARFFVTSYYKKHNINHRALRPSPNQHNLSTDIKNLLGIRPFSSKLGGQSLLVVIALMALQWLVLSQTDTMPMLFMDELMADGNLLAMIVAVVFMAPICEEMVFRGAMFGFIQRGFDAKTGKLIAIIMTSAVFVLVHFQYDLLTLFLLFLMALAWGYYRALTGSVILTTLLHIFNNGCAMAFYLLFGA